MLSTFEKARDAGQNDINFVPSINVEPYDEDHLIGLLSRQIDNPNSLKESREFSS